MAPQLFRPPGFAIAEAGDRAAPRHFTLTVAGWHRRIAPATGGLQINE